MVEGADPAETPGDGLGVRHNKYRHAARIAQFQQEYPNIKIKYSTAASNEEMLIKLSAPDSIYDICFPSEYTIEKMIAQNMLHELNKANIPNLKNID